MTYFSSLAPEMRSALAGILFIAVMSQLALCLYRYICSGRIKYCIKNGFFFLVLLILLSVITAMSQRNYAGSRLKLPWIIIMLFSAVIFSCSVIGMKREYDKSRQKLSPASVKQTLDNLNSGVFFADDSGKIILINHVMRELTSLLTGSYPRMAGEFWSALDNIKMNSKVLKTEDKPALYRFPDGKIWQFHTAVLSGEGMTGYTQTTAQDVTELYAVSSKLKEENDKLKQTNEKMQVMYDRLADRIREEEILTLKTRIHDAIGTSLITISKIMNDGKNGNVDKQLQLLQNALSYFSFNDFAPHGTFEDIRRRAREMNVELLLDGYIPQNDTISEIITSAARECVTNCIQHANGSRVIVKITEHTSIFTVIITNNGDVPKEKIVEGGGLSALRKTVETYGGEMYISHSPGFALILNLPEKEQKL